MAALVCDICGGKLMAKSGGIFECEYCGMQYDKTRIQEMVQEIKGTVRVEGTVEVKGTVAVDNKSNIENLLKRIAICAEDREFEKAKELTEELLKMDPECGEAYLWKLCAKYKLTSLDALLKRHLQELEWTQNTTEWKNALRYLDEKKSIDLKKQMDDAISYWKKDDPELKKRFVKIQPFQNLLFTCRKSIIGLRADGTVKATYSSENKWLSPVNSWKGVKKLAVNDIYDYVIGLCWDGSFLAVHKSENCVKEIIDKVLSWNKYVDEAKYIDFVADGLFIAALDDDGEVCSTLDSTEDGYIDDTFYYGYAAEWEDVRSMHVVSGTAKDIEGVYFGKEFSRYSEFKYRMLLGVTEDGEVRYSASWTNLDIDPDWYGNCVPSDLEQKLNIPKWEKLENVDRINATRRSSVLFKDGKLATDCGDNSIRGKWLDFNITDKGILCKWFSDMPDETFKERNLLAESGYCALRADGTILRGFDNFLGGENHASEEVEKWTDIVAINWLYPNGMIGLKEDGTVLLSWGKEPIPGISVKGWKLFDSLETFNDEREAAEKKFLAEAEIIARKKREEEESIAQQKKEEERRISAMRRAEGLCQHCGGEFKGFFTKKCSSCGTPKDY